MGFLDSGGQAANSFGQNFIQAMQATSGMGNDQFKLLMQAQDAAQNREIRAAQLAEFRNNLAREKGFQTAIQSGITAPQSENDALFAASQNPQALQMRPAPLPNQPDRQAAVMTPEGDQQIQGLMSGGFDSSKAMAAAMPYTKAEQFPQMLTAMKAIEMMPLEQQIKLLDMVKTQSEIKKNTSDNVTAVAAGDKIVFYDKKTGNKIREEKVGVSPNAQVRIDNRPAALPKLSLTEHEDDNGVVQKYVVNLNTGAEKQLGKVGPKGSNARIERKTAADAEAKLLANKPDAPENDAYASMYNDAGLPNTYEKQTVSSPGTLWGTNSTEKWVKVPRQKGTSTNTIKKPLSSFGR